MKRVSLTERKALERQLKGLQGTKTAATVLRGDITFGAGSGSANWGGIGGTLSDQTDLQTALNAKAATSSLAAVATSGAYSDLSGRPTLGTAAATAATDYATAAQGATADSALQPNGNGSSLTGLTKSQVGLGNVDNTSDANKPISTATQTALDAKQATLVSATNIKTINGSSVLGSGDLAVGGSVADGDKGDITVSASGATWTIDNDAVTYAKMQNVSATNRFLGRITAGSGDPEELTGTQATTLLDAFTSGLKGLAPASGGGTANFLRADGTWAAPPGGSGQSLVVAAGAADSAAVSNSNVNHFSKVVTVAAGDVFWFEVHGRIHNNAGATRTYTHGIGLGGLTLDCRASTTIAANTISAFFIWGTIAVRSTSSVYWTIQTTTLPVSTDNGAAVTSVSRHAWRTSGTNITGSQTALAYIRSSGTGTQTRWVHGYILRQIGSI